MGKVCGATCCFVVCGPGGPLMATRAPLPRRRGLGPVGRPTLPTEVTRSHTERATPLTGMGSTVDHVLR